MINIDDPLQFLRLCWPDMVLYDRQVEILYSVKDNDETIVPAGNQLGKDFISGVIVLWFFCSRSPCRIVTSSSGQSQLKSVLWGEIRNLLRTTRYDLPIQVNDMLIRQVDREGNHEPKSYILGLVTNVPENLLGHHLPRDDGRPRTMVIYDEASSIENQYYDASDTWAHRKLIIGNPLPCANFFKTFVKAGDVPRDNAPGYYRKIIKIKAEQSPNVRLAMSEIAQGLEPSNRILVPGVVDYPTYQKRRKLWDKIRQTIGLDAEFYEGAEVLLYPPDWLDRAERLHRQRLEMTRAGYKRRAKSMGVDTGEGEANSVWTVIDELGIIEQFSKKTPNTMDIPRLTLLFMRKHKLKPGQVFMDRGGGGKQIADYMRQQGHHVHTVGFGEAATAPVAYKVKTKNTEKVEDASETSYVYKNRRAEMYGLLRILLNPIEEITEDLVGIHRTLKTLSNKNLEKWNLGFSIPEHCAELRRQLAPIPLLYDAGDRLYLPPKSKKNPDSKELTLTDLIGCSPDEADSLVLAVYGMLRKPARRVLGAF